MNVLPFSSSLYSIPYLVFYSILYLFIPFQNSTIQYRSLKTLSIYYLIFSFVVFFGFRGYLYSDWYNYYNEFEKIPTGLNGFLTIIQQNRNEVFFYLYMSFSKTLINDYLFFQLLSFCIDLIVLLVFVNRYVPNQCVLFFCLYLILSGFSIEFNLLRNAKSIMLFLLSIKYLESKRYLRYVFLNCIGCLFHTSSLIYIILMPFFTLDISIQKLIFVFLFANLVYLTQVHWVQYLLVLSLEIVDLGNVSTLITKYLESKRYSAAYGFSLGYLERTFTFFLLLRFRSRLFKFNSGLIFFNITIIYLLVYLLFSEMNIFILRFPILFVCGYLVVYPRIYSLVNRNTKLLFLFIVFVYGFIRIFVMNQLGLCSYDNFLTGNFLDVNQRSYMFKSYKSRID